MKIAFKAQNRIQGGNRIQRRNRIQGKNAFKVDFARGLTPSYKPSMVCRSLVGPREQRFSQSRSWVF